MRRFGLNGLSSVAFLVLGVVACSSSAPDTIESSGAAVSTCQNQTTCPSGFQCNNHVCCDPDGQYGCRQTSDCCDANAQCLDVRGAPVIPGYPGTCQVVPKCVPHAKCLGASDCCVPGDQCLDDNGRPLSDNPSTYGRCEHVDTVQPPNVTGQPWFAQLPDTIREGETLVRYGHSFSPTTLVRPDGQTEQYGDIPVVFGIHGDGSLWVGNGWNANYVSLSGAFSYENVGYDGTPTDGWSGTFTNDGQLLLTNVWQQVDGQTYSLPTGIVLSAPISLFRAQN